MLREGSLRAGALTVAVCTVLVALAGCGSGGSSATTATTTARTATSGGLKSDTTPRFASPSPSEPVQSGTVQIAYRDITINPDTVRAKVGSTIRWVNEDSEPCNVTSEGGPYHIASGTLGEGATFELKLDRPGVIHYECTSYPATMNGTIEAVG
jgi:plastocyanin